MVIPIGRLADQTSRRDVIAVALTVWALGTICSGLSSSYLGLFGSRMLVGLGTAGFYPVAEASIADFFPASERGRAYGMFGFSFMFGCASTPSRERPALTRRRGRGGADFVGFAGGGWLIHHTDWRTAFILIGAPQLGVGALLHFTTPSVSTPRLTSSLWADLCELSKLKTLRAIWVGIFFSTVAASMNKFQPSFYQRVHHLSVAEVRSSLLPSPPLSTPAARRPAA